MKKAAGDQGCLSHEHCRPTLYSLNINNNTNIHGTAGPPVFCTRTNQDLCAARILLNMTVSSLLEGQFFGVFTSFCVKKRWEETVARV